MYAFNWALTAFRSESYIGSATALPDLDLLLVELLYILSFVVVVCSIRLTVCVEHSDAELKQAAAVIKQAVNKHILT